MIRAATSAASSNASGASRLAISRASASTSTTTRTMTGPLLPSGMSKVTSLMLHMHSSAASYIPKWDILLWDVRLRRVEGPPFTTLSKAPGVSGRGAALSFTDPVGSSKSRGSPAVLRVQVREWRTSVGRDRVHPSVQGGWRLPGPSAPHLRPVTHASLSLESASLAVRLRQRIRPSIPAHESRGGHQNAPKSPVLARVNSDANRTKRARAERKKPRKSTTYGACN